MRGSSIVSALVLLPTTITVVEGRLSVPLGAKNFSLCERLHPEDLPPECSCREPGHYSVIIECLKDFESPYFNDTIGMKIDLDPCNADGSRISVDVTEQNHNIDFPIAGISAGEERNIPIPGLSIAVPMVGHLGVDVAIKISGNPDSLTLKVGLNACAALAHKIVCASAIPGLSNILPWYVLSGTYSFGDVCNSTTTTNIQMARPAKTSQS